MTPSCVGGKMQPDSKAEVRGKDRSPKTRESHKARADRHEFNLRGLLEYAQKASDAPSNSSERNSFAPFACGWIKQAMKTIEQRDAECAARDAEYAASVTRTTHPNPTDQPDSNTKDL